MILTRGQTEKKVRSLFDYVDGFIKTMMRLKQFIKKDYMHVTGITICNYENQSKYFNIERYWF